MWCFLFLWGGGTENIFVIYTKLIPRKIFFCIAKILVLMVYKYIQKFPIKVHRGRGHNFPIFISCRYLVELGPRQLGLPVPELNKKGQADNNFRSSGN